MFQDQAPQELQPQLRQEGLPETQTPPRMKAGELRLETRNFSPSMARRWASEYRFPYQRPRSETRCAFHGTNLQAGRWRLSTMHVHHAVEDAVDWPTNVPRIVITDGQHRLEAIGRQGGTWPVIVVHHAVDSWEQVRRDYESYDPAQSSRIFKDMIPMSGLTEDLQINKTSLGALNSAVKWVECGLSDMPSLERSGMGFGNLQMRIAAARGWKTEAQMYFGVAYRKSAGTTLLMRRMSVCGVGLVTCRFQAEKAIEFWNKLAGAGQLVENDPVWHLKERLSTPRVPGTELKPSFESRLVAAAWNAFMEGRSGINCLKVMRPDEPLKLVGTPFDGQKKRPNLEKPRSAGDSSQESVTQAA